VTREPSSPLVTALPELDAEVERRRNYKIKNYFKDTGPYRRELYPKHEQFFRAGAHHRTRAFIAGNRVGKSETGAFETALHLTGDYPDWWVGRRFDGPVNVWAAGDTAKTVRDILQEKLLGPPGAPGTGMIPAHLIQHQSAKQGLSDAVESLWVRHCSGRTSVLGFKSYDQRREAFQGTAQHLIWLDEEPPEDILTESIIRTAQTSDFPGGMVMLTFTPLQGLTPLILSFLPGGSISAPADGNVIFCDWSEVPHLSDREKDDLIARIPPHQRDARTKGIPSLGSGAIYLVPESDIRVKDFEIPRHWPRGFALDTGWDSTAAVWGALDREAQVLYVYAVYKRGQAEPQIHAGAILARGAWIRGVGDAAAINNNDGRQFLEIYRQLGLKLQLADKAVEAGIQEVWELLSAGRLKVFDSCGAWFEEFRLYRRDDKGRIVKQNDHLMDATRYLVRARAGMRTESTPKTTTREFAMGPISNGLGWMA
jgi:phage terminase large subunit-like protein